MAGARSVLGSRDSSMRWRTCYEVSNNMPTCDACAHMTWHAKLWHHRKPMSIPQVLLSTGILPLHRSAGNWEPSPQCWSLVGRALVVVWLPGRDNLGHYTGQRLLQYIRAMHNTERAMWVADYHTQQGTCNRSTSIQYTLVLCRAYLGRAWSRTVLCREYKITVALDVEFIVLRMIVNECSRCYEQMSCNVLTKKNNYSSS